MRATTRVIVSVVALLVSLPWAVASLRAQVPVRVSILVGFGPGLGNDQPARPDAATYAANRMSPDMSYDQTARFLARHLGRFLDGEPVMEARHAPGGAGFVAARRLAGARPDGSVLALLSANVAFASALGLPGADVAADRLTWLGAVAPERWACVRRTQAGDEPTWTGTMGAGSRADLHARAMRDFAGAPLTIMAGYASRFELIRALESGELDAACGWPMSDLETRRADWFASRRFDVFAIFSPSGKGPPTPPADARSAAALDALSREAEIAWPLAGPPGMAPALAAAFADALTRLGADAGALEDAQRMGLTLEPISAARVSEVVQALHTAPEPVKRALAALFTPKDPTSSQARRLPVR